MLYLPCVFTQPAGVRPSGTLVKSAMNGSFGATRMRACALRSPTSRRRFPNWQRRLRPRDGQLGFRPVARFQLALEVGRPLAPGAGGGGVDATGQTGGSIGPGFQSTLTSPSARPWRRRRRL